MNMLNILRGMKQNVAIAMVCLFFIGIRPTEASPLEDVLVRVRQASTSGEAPVVVFDLDDTLISTRERTQRILVEFGREDVIAGAFPREAKTLEDLKSHEIHYELSDTLAIFPALTAESLLFLARPYWASRFFSNQHVAQDVAMAGAPAYVNKVLQTGGFVVYLSGRDEPRMGAGTRSSLRHHGLPLSAKTSLMLKPNKEIPDLTFKKEAFASIDSLGVVVGCFENEPANINAMSDRWPAANMVFIDSIHSKKPDVPKVSIPWIKGYEE